MKMDELFEEVKPQAWKARMTELESKRTGGGGPRGKHNLSPEELKELDFLRWIQYNGKTVPKLAPRSGPYLHITYGGNRGVQLVKRNRAIHVELINDYYSAKDKKYDKLFSDSGKGYLEAYKYAYEFTSKI